MRAAPFFRRSRRCNLDLRPRCRLRTLGAASGKRPAHLGLLSGGEKALGGIAWLFALLSVKPSPFVVLDEVEASLDESNAARFAQYLQEFRRTTQCVIVTHQKATMEIADALWGVAGNGQGESRLVSVLMEEVSS